MLAQPYQDNIFNPFKAQFGTTKTKSTSFNFKIFKNFGDSRSFY